MTYVPADRRPEFVDQGLGPEPAREGQPPRTPRNPWLTTLIATFMALFALAVLFGAAAVAAVQPTLDDGYTHSSYGNPAAVLPLSILAASSLALGILVLMMFVTARAVQWKAP